MKPVRFDKIVGPYRIEWDGEALRVTGDADTAVSTVQSVRYDPDVPVVVTMRQREYGDGDE